MGFKKIFTEEELSWLAQNYNTMSLKDCAKHLQVSVELTRRTARTLGVHLGKKKPIERDNETSHNVKNNYGYCIDCDYYQEGGMCERYRKITGALHQKECFKEKEL